MQFPIRIALAVLCAGIASAQADESFRCGKWIVNSSLSLDELKTRCGKPSYQESKTEDVRARNRDTGLMVKMGETTTETWTYDRGRGASPMVVTIVDGRIKGIDRKR